MKQKLSSILTYHPRLLATVISIGIGFAISIAFGIGMELPGENVIPLAEAANAYGRGGCC